MGALNSLEESIGIKRCSDSSVDAICITIAKKVVKIVHACDDGAYKESQDAEDLQASRWIEAWIENSLDRDKATTVV